MPTEYTDCLIIGGGLAGLACARTLQEAGQDYLLVEAADAVGGRVRTDERQGFLLDRGFQVLLAAYPEAQRQLDYAALHLQPFFAGAYVMRGGEHHLVADPWRHPLAAVGTLGSPVSGWKDRFRVARLRQETASTDGPPALRPIEDIPTADYLKRLGFSENFQSGFLRPFFRGIFLEADLSTSARMFHFVFGMMARGKTVLPLTGMEAIPRQMASRLHPDSILTGSRCASLRAGTAEFAGGKAIRFRRAVLATEAAVAHRLLGWPGPPAARATTCLYFAATRSPLARPAICLNGDGKGVVNHVAVPSDVSPRYAPPGASLISVSVVGVPSVPDGELARMVREELRGWFGASVEAWEFLCTYRIPAALPNQDPGSLAQLHSGALPDGVVLCGDHTADGSIDGALRSGRAAAEAVLQA